MLRAVLFPVTATGMIALTAYVVHVVLTGLWPRDWPPMVVVGDPVWDSAWLMLLVHWVLVIALGVIIQLAGVRGPLE